MALEGILMALVGCYSTAIGYGKLSVSKNPEENAAFLAKHGQKFRACGLLLIGIGVLLAVVRPMMT